MSCSSIADTQYRPFLEIVTRHMTTRPGYLAQNKASVATMLGDWRQTFLVDNVGRGVPWANANLGDYAPYLAGEYIWILDDDDLCIYPPLVHDLMDIAAKHDPDVVFLKMDHLGGGVLPDKRTWGHAPVYGRIGISAYVVRRAVWQAHACAWLPKYESDFTFIEHVWQSKPRVYWHDVVASRIQRRSVGRPE